MKRSSLLPVLALAALVALPVAAAERNGYSLTVEVNGDERPEYAGNGNLYVEAMRGRPYALRITNPMPYRVAVALSVDGLNTIDAKHSDAWSASKWVLDPYESTTIEGWQVSGSTARKFFFTGESRSYGAALGQTRNLGVIQAVFYREREQVWREYAMEDRRRDATSGSPAPRPQSQRAPSAKQEGAGATSDDYAATGMGDRTRHDVTRVAVDLDPAPVASISLRYEFRPQLVKLGVLREPRILDRRERAHGFDGPYCPQVN